MDYDLNISPQAKKDITDGFFWYEEKQLGLGRIFIEEIDLLISYIQKNPFHFQIKYSNKFRQAVIKKFPYVIIFELIANFVVIFSVFPTKKNPDKKYNFT